MSSLLESEIHRLILGYLKDEAKCPQTAESFLNESKLLGEVKKAMSRKNRGRSLNVGGQKLLDFLENNDELANEVVDIFDAVTDEEFKDHPEVTHLQKEVHGSDGSVRKLRGIKDLLRRLLKQKPTIALNEQRLPKQQQKGSGSQKRQISRARKLMLEKEQKALKATATRIQDELLAKNKLRLPQSAMSSTSAAAEATISTTPIKNVEQVGNEVDSLDKYNPDALKISLTPSISRKTKNTPRKVENANLNLDQILPHPSENDKKKLLKVLCEESDDQLRSTIGDPIQSLLTGAAADEIKLNAGNFIPEDLLDNLENLLNKSEGAKEEEVVTLNYSNEEEIATLNYSTELNNSISTPGHEIQVEAEEIVATVPEVTNSRKRPNAEFSHIFERKRRKVEKVLKPRKVHQPPSRISKRHWLKGENKRRLNNFRVTMAAILTWELEENVTYQEMPKLESKNKFSQVAKVTKSHLDNQSYIILYDMDNKSMPMTAEFVTAVSAGASPMESLGLIEQGQLEDSGGIIQLQQFEENVLPEVVLEEAIISTPQKEAPAKSSPLKEESPLHVADIPIISTPQKETPAKSTLKDLLSTAKKSPESSEVNLCTPEVVVSALKSLVTPVRNLSPEENINSGPQYFTSTPPKSQTKNEKQDTPGLKFLQEMSSHSEASCSEDSQSPFNAKRKSTSLSVRARNEAFRKNIGLAIEDSIQKAYQSPEKQRNPVRHFAAPGLKMTPIKSPLKSLPQRVDGKKNLLLGSPHKIKVSTPEKSPLKQLNFGTPQKINLATPPKAQYKFKTPITTSVKSKAQILRLKQQTGKKEANLFQAASNSPLKNSEMSNVNNLDNFEGGQSVQHNRG